MTDDASQVLKDKPGRTGVDDFNLSTCEVEYKGELDIQLDHVG